MRFWIDVEHFYESIINREVDNEKLTENALSIYDR
jgi:hypothetical protein